LEDGVPARHKKVRRGLRQQQALKLGAVTAPVSAGLILTAAASSYAAGPAVQISSLQVKESASRACPAHTQQLTPQEWQALAQLTPKERNELAQLTAQECAALAGLTPQERQELARLSPQEQQELARLTPQQRRELAELARQAQPGSHHGGGSGSSVQSPANATAGQLPPAKVAGAQEPTIAETTNAVVKPETAQEGRPVMPAQAPPLSPAAPYLNLNQKMPNVTKVMNETGIKTFSMAFIHASGGCKPAWNNGPLMDAAHRSTINAIRAAGGDVIPSISGWSGNKLGPNCGSPEALAGAYQKVIDAYDFRAIDVDIENTDEFENPAVRERILGALKIVKQNNPGLKTIITFGSITKNPTGNLLIERAAALKANIDVFTIMPFDIGGGSDIYGATVNATEALKNKLKSTFGWDDATAYAHIGISGMNGRSDGGEINTPETWTRIRDWANSHHIGRLAFWSVNRDRPCPNGGTVGHCSGTDHEAWKFTSITAGFTG
jgi:hypothetical protein